MDMYYSTENITVNNKSATALLDIQSINPPWWARGGHLQTILAHLLPSAKIQTHTRLTIPLRDGDKLFADACIVDSSPYIVSLYHGLSGDIDSDYMRRTAHLCARLGLSWVRVNHRNAGEGFGLATKPYHSGRSHDVSDTLDYLKSLYPGKKHLCIGFSMSGNILLHLIAKMGGETMPDAVITVNAPIQLYHAALRLRRGLNQIYDKRFSVDLIKLLRMKQEMGLEKRDFKIPALTSVYDLDQLYTAPACGYKDRFDYYEQCSTVNFVKNIETPSLVLTAEDDPFIDVNDYKSATWSQHTNLVITKYGGHLGYLTKGEKPGSYVRWLDQFLEKGILYFTSPRV